MNAKELKELSENRAAKAKEVVALLNKKDLTQEERAALTSGKSELASMDDRLTRAAEAVAMAASTPISLSEKEERDVSRFDLARALRASAGIAGETMDGIEREMVQEGAREAQEANVPLARGIILPRMLVRRSPRAYGRFGREQRAMTATGTTSTSGDQGGMTVATIPQGLLDSFYSRLVLANAGATVLEGLRGNLNLPRYVKDTDPSFKTENATAGALNPTTAMLSLTPHRLPAYTDISEQLLMQSSVNVETVIRNNVLKQLSARLQAAHINGSGTAPEIKGLISQVGTTVYAGGADLTIGTNANGAAQVFPDWVNLETAVAVQDADIGSLAYVTNPKVRGQAKQTRKGLKTPSDTSVTDSNMIWQNGNEVNGYQAYTTTSVPSNFTKGTGTGLSALIFGDWTDFYMAFWSGINLELVRDATLATQGFWRLCAAVYADGGIVRPVSFAAMTDIAA